MTRGFLFRSGMFDDFLHSEKSGDVAAVTNAAAHLKAVMDLQPKPQVEFVRSKPPFLGRAQPYESCTCHRCRRHPRRGELATPLRARTPPPPPP